MKYLSKLNFDDTTTPTSTALIHTVHKPNAPRTPEVDFDSSFQLVSQFDLGGLVCIVRVGRLAS